MGEKKHKREHMPEAEEVSEILEAVSDKIPALIKGVISSLFSEDAAKGMARAAATYYKELKEGGIPDELALKMTKDYMGMLTSIGEAFKGMHHEGKGEEIGEEIKREILKKIRERKEE